MTKTTSAASGRPYSDEKEDIVADFINRLLHTQVNYVGIYKPGDFAAKTYRVILPRSNHRNANGNVKKTKTGAKQKLKQNRFGRGYHGCREDVLLETTEREDIDRLINDIKDLVGRPNGPIAVRHIINPSQNKDEGLRVIWSKDLAELGGDAKLEMQDWERRDEMIKSGRTVQPPFQYLQFQSQLQFSAIPNEYWCESNGQSRLILTPTSPNPYQYQFGYMYGYGYPIYQQVEQQSGQEGWIRFDGATEERVDDLDLNQEE